MTAMIRPPSGLSQADIDAAIAEAIGPVSPPLIVSGSAIGTHAFTDLKGGTAFRIQLKWVKGALSNSAILIRPNGISTNQLTTYTQGDASAGSGDLSINGLAVAVGNRGPGGFGEAIVDFATGTQKVGATLFGIGGDPATPTSNRNCNGYLIWNDTATAITSLQIDCVDAGTLLAAADLLPGTTIHVYKIR